MTQPTGDHATAAKLAAGYVEVGVQYAKGMDQIHKDFDAVEEHGKVVGANTGKNIVEAVGASGAPAAKALGDNLRAAAEPEAKKTSATIVSSLLGGLRDGMASANTDFGFLFNGAREHAEIGGAAAAEGFTSRFWQLMQSKLPDSERVGEEHGAAVGRGLRRGAEDAGSFALGDVFRKASEGLGGLGKQAGETGEQVGGLGEKLGGIAAPLALFADPAVLGVGGVLALAGGLGVVIDKLYEMGEGWEKTFNTVRTMTGATGDQLKGLEDDVKGVYANTTQTQSQVAQIVSTVATSFKDSGDSVGQVSTVISQLEARFGQIDLSTLGQGFRAFKVGGDQAGGTAQNQIAVLEQLAAAQQKTQIPMDALINAMARAAPIADQFHLSIGETTAVMAEFDQAGIDPSRTMFTLATAAKNATKEHKDFATVLQDTITQINNAQTQEEKLQIAQGLVGPTSGRGGAAQLVQFANSGATLDPQQLDQIAKAGSVIEDNFKATMTWGDTWTLFKHKMSDALEPTANDLREKVQGGLQNVVTWLSAHQGDIVNFADGAVRVFDRIGTVISDAFHKAQPVVEAVFNYLRPAVEQLGPPLRQLAEALGPFLGAAFRDLEPIVKVVGEALIWLLKEAIQLLPRGISEITTVVKDATVVLNAIHTAVVDVWDAGKKLVDWCKGDGHTGFLGLKGDVDPIVKVFDDVWDALKKVGDYLSNDFKTAWNDVKGVIDPVITDIGKGLDTVSRLIHDVPGLDHVPGFATPGHADGGPIVHGQTGLALGGYGGGDVVPAMLEPGEHVTTKEEVAGIGGHENMYLVRQLMRQGILREILGFNQGGDVPLGQIPYYRPDPNEPGSNTLAPGMWPRPHDPYIPGSPYGKAKQNFPDWWQDVIDSPGDSVPWWMMPGGQNPHLDFGGVEGGTWAHHAGGGKIRPAGSRPRRETGWVMDRYRMSQPGKTHFDTGGDVPYDTPVGDVDDPTFSVGLARQEEHRGWLWSKTLAHIPFYTTLFGAPGDDPGKRPLSSFLNPKDGTGWTDDPGKSGGGPIQHFQDGGEVAVKALLAAESGRTPYVFGGYSPKGIDCSGLVAEAVSVYLGLPVDVGNHPMSTGNEANWLAAHGFVQGVGPEGSFRVGFYNGGEGGGHTALTLPDGTNAESGGSGGGVRLGGGAAGANSAEFTDHWYLPPRSIVEPGGYAGTGSSGSGGYGGAGGSNGATGGGGGSYGGAGTPATAAQLATANDAVTNLQGQLQVANDRLAEAENRPIKGKTEKAQAAEEATKAADIKRLTDARDKIQDDLDTKTGERDDLAGSNNATMTEAQNRLTTATQRLHDAQTKLQDDQANPKIKPSQIQADQDAITRATEAQGRAQDHLNRVTDHGTKAKKESSAQQKVDPYEQLGNVAFKGLQENLPQGFSDPTSWSGVKSVAALMKFGAGLAGATGQPGAQGALTIFGDLLSGSGGNFGKDIGTLIAGGTPGAQAQQQVAGAGNGVPQSVSDLVAQTPGYTPPANPDAPEGGNGSGTTVNIDRSANFTGDITDMATHTAATAAYQQRRVNSDLKLQRLVWT